VPDKSKLIVTGVHGTLDPAGILKLTGAGLLVRGEPEMTVTEIFEGKPISEIEGLSYFQDGRLVSTPDREPLDLNALPLPDYGAVDLADYRYEFLGGRYALLQFSRGCPFDCIFCLKKMYGRGYRTKTPERFVQELDYVVNRAGARSV
jgi:anaerobic magnesium-protoporphyrin IX monomethyl ester cyclase